MKRITVFLKFALLAIGLILLLTGCGPKESADSQEATPSTTSNEQQPPAHSPIEPPSDRPVAANTAAPTPDANAEPPSTPNSPAPDQPSVGPDFAPSDTKPEGLDQKINFSKSVQALKSLDNYRYTTVMKYEGTDASGTESVTTTVIGEYSAPDSYRLVIIDSTEEQGAEFVKIGESLWVYDDGRWMKVSENAAASVAESIFGLALDFVWEALASSLEDKTRYIGKETINGTLSLHYSSSSSYWQSHVGQGFGDAQGDIWIAEEGYPIKFTFTASGTNEDGDHGSIQWNSNITGVNSGITIAPPISD
jgi:hypothetical protein